MKIRTIAIACIAGALLQACGGKDQAGSVLRYVTTDEPKRLDPAYIKDLYEGIVSGLIYDGLVIFGKGPEVQPGLAERWEISPDGRIYTFHLRPDARFADGRSVTASDVRYSFTRVLRPRTNSDRKWVLNRIAGAAEVTSGTAAELRGLDTPDSHTVRITLEEPYPVFLTMLAMPTASIIPENSAGSGTSDRTFDEKPMGSGPWVLDNWLHDQRIEFRRNDHFWGKKPSFERFVYVIQADDKAQRQAFEVGNVDIYQVGFTVYPAWSADPEKSPMMKAAPELRTDYVGIMCSKPALSDKLVRQAIAHGINTRNIFENIQKGRGVIAHGPVPPGIPGYRVQIAPRAYDPQRSRDLLTSAGVPSLNLDLWYRDEALNSEIAAAVKSDLAKVGITVRLVPRDQAALRAGIWDGQPDLFLAAWTLDYPDLENAIYPPFHSGNIPRQGNQAHFDSPNATAMIDSARAESDPQARLEKYAAAEDAIIEECPWVFLFHRKTYYAVQPRVKNWEPALIYNADRFTEVLLDPPPTRSATR